MLNKYFNRKTYFIFGMFILFIMLSLIIPFNHAPDEKARYLLAQYMYHHTELPSGLNPEVRIEQWGQSYAFSPYLSYMIGAFFMKLVSLFTTSVDWLLYAARFSSVLSSTFSVCFIIKIADKLFSNRIKWLFITLCSTLPCFVFISSYVNADALAVLSSAIIIYAWLIGMETDWDRRSCIYLIIGLSICVLSYKNAYGFILVTMGLYIYELFKAGKKENVIALLKKGLVIFVLVTIFGGWFYFHNYLIYDGDFMGSETSRALAEQYAINSLKPSMRMTPSKSGYSIWYMLKDMKWLDLTYHSFIGIFDYMSLRLPDCYYKIFSAIFVSGLLGCVLKHKGKQRKNDRCIRILLFFCAIIPVLLNIYYSYFQDFQPQGRYALPMVIPLMFFVTYGFENILSHINKTYHNYIVYFIIILLLYLCLYMIVHVFGYMYVF